MNFIVLNLKDWSLPWAIEHLLPFQLKKNVQPPNSGYSIYFGLLLRWTGKRKQNSSLIDPFVLCKISTGFFQDQSYPEGPWELRENSLAILPVFLMRFHACVYSVQQCCRVEGGGSGTYSIVLRIYLFFMCLQQVVIVHKYLLLATIAKYGAIDYFLHTSS